jgi:hypothetical protein
LRISESEWRKQDSDSRLRLGDVIPDALRAYANVRAVQSHGRVSKKGDLMAIPENAWL